MTRKPLNDTPYALSSRPPLVYTLSYIIVILLAGYALGVRVANPLGAIPTGYAVLSPTLADYNDSRKSAALEVINSVRKAASPPEYRDKPRVTVNGFSMLPPVAAAIRFDAGGVLDAGFLKTMPTGVEIKDVTVVNAVTGVECRNIEYDSVLASSQDSFTVHATGCDTRTTVDDGGVLTYNVTMEYDVAFGSVSATHKNTGQIHVWV